MKILIFSGICAAIALNNARSSPDRPSESGKIDLRFVERPGTVN